MFFLARNSEPKPIKKTVPPAAKSSSRPNKSWEAVALRALPVKPKLAVSRASDPEEREADRIADRVISAGPAQSRFSVSANPGPKCGSCEEERENKVQRKQAASDVSAGVGDLMVGEAGHQLDAESRSAMEPR